MLGNRKKENICPDHFPDFNLGSFIIIKSMFIMKNLTDFRKTVETGVNPHLEKVNKPRASKEQIGWGGSCLLYTSPSPRDGLLSRMPSSA